MGGKSCNCETKACGPWFQTIRTMPGLTVVTNRPKPLVLRQARPAFMFMLCGINSTKKGTNMSPAERTLTVARRATQVLATAATIIDQTPTIHYWSTSEVWQATPRKLADNEPRWKRATIPKATEDVMNILINARVNVSATARAAQGSTDDVQKFLKALDHFIEIQAQYNNLRSRPRHHAQVAAPPRHDQAAGDHLQNQENASIGEMDAESDGEKPVIKPEPSGTIPASTAATAGQALTSPEMIERVQDRDRELQDLQENYADLDDENDELLEENDKLADHCDELEDTIWDYQRWLTADGRTIRVQEIMISRNQEAMRRQQAEIQRLRGQNALLQARSILQAWAQYQEGRRHHS
ncbi:hypothetical protein CGCVW01_v009851 [Colletotrichum viniferum]|nr:hypothetical protein CGCVW01_v009851 [Colletotrichum viniferum]